MKPNEFNEIAIKLRRAYKRDGFLSDDADMDFWYEMLSDLNPKYAAQAVTNYIRNNRFQPTIADIRHEHDLIVEDIRAKTQNLKEILDVQLSYWPNVDKGKETWSLLAELINKHGGRDWTRRTNYARQLADEIFKHVRHCEETGEKLESDIKDYLRTLL